MPLVCRNCSRVNPADALYCYHDGAVLNGLPGGASPVIVGARQFHNPFVFPSGRRCRSFDELVLACESNWTEAQDLLRQGYFEGFLGGLGRADLARAARLLAQASDSERALDEFLSKLPASTRQPAHLEVRPLEINLGQLARDQDQRLTLDLANLGMGLVSGSVSTACDWISLGDGAGSPRKLVQFRTETSIPVRIISKCLRAGARKLEGRLSLETNGGGATVVIRAEVPVKPFPSGVLAGAKTPRELASRARQHIKEAAPCFERGEVEQWYTTNGWTYPVVGPNFSGIHAIQQFFEALGLVTPPRVEISTRSIHLAGSSGNALTEEIKVQAEEKKPVFAHGVSSVPWLKVGKTILEGRVARIPISVPTVPSLPGERLQAWVDVTANGNQRFTVDVTLNIAGTPGMRGRVPEPILELAEVAAIPVLPAPLVEVNYADIDWQHAPPLNHAGGSLGASAVPAAIPLVPSIADLYGTSAPVATVVPLSDGPEDEPVLEVIPVNRGTARESRPDGSGEPSHEPLFATETALDVVPVAEAVEDVSPPAKKPFWIHLLPLGFLTLCLLVTLIRDLAALAWSPAVDASGDPLDPNPRITLRFHDQETRVTIARNSGGIKAEGDEKATNIRPAIWEPSMRFGLLMLNERDRTGQLKRLTYQEPGTTNNTVVKLDGEEWIFGERPFREMDGRFGGDWPGRWQDGLRDVRLPQTAYSVEGRRSTWVYDAVRVEVTQTVEIVRGLQSNQFDTCLVRYRLHNKDTRPHRLGIRFLLDTYIGGNDGVPFLIPGARALCSTSLDFSRAQIPDFIQALENEDLAHPGTIAQVGLRLGGGLESPDRVTLGAWPSPQLRERDSRCRQEKTLWEVPILKIHTLVPGDSAVTIYWNEKDLAPGQTRDVGFSYGLGNVSGGEGRGKLALTVGGSFAPRGEFTATAYVSNPVHGQTVTLTLPDGFDLIDGKPMQQVPLPDLAVSRNSPVTWKVRGPRQEGTYNLKVNSSTGVSQTQTVKIRARGIFGE